MKKLKKKQYTVNVKRDVFFEARIEADTMREAFEKAEAMSTDELWNTPGDIIDDEHKITAVFE